MSINDGFPYEMIFDKKLNEDSLELLRREYQKILAISKMKMDSIGYQLFLDRNGEVLLPKDCLIYGVNAKLDVLDNISKKGILAEELEGKKKDGFTYYCADFYRIPSDILLSCYDKSFTPDDKTPFNTVNDNIAFVINQNSKIGGLLYYDLYDSKFDNNPIVMNIVNRKDILSESLIDNRGKNAAILAGIPANAISGIILGDKVLLNDNLILEIKRLFPNSYIITRKGNIIRDRSNIIKVEDYENIALKYAKESIKVSISNDVNKKLQKENDELKNSFLKYMNAVRDNTTTLEQAKILLDIGYRILPSSLKDKLSEEELEILELKNTKWKNKKSDDKLLFFWYNCYCRVGGYYERNTNL